MKNGKLFDKHFLQEVRITDNKHRNTSFIDSIDMSILFCPIFQLTMKIFNIPQGSHMPEKELKRWRWNTTLTEVLITLLELKKNNKWEEQWQSKGEWSIETAYCFLFNRILLKNQNKITMPSSYRRRERHVCVFRSTHHRLKLFSTFRNEDIYQNVLQIIGFSVNLVKSLRSNDPEADKKKMKRV